MLGALLKKIFGTKHQRDVKRMMPAVQAIHGVRPELEGLADAELRVKTEEFKKRVAEGAQVEDLLVEAFAVCREAAWRRIGMRHFDVQLIGGMVLHEGTIAEMATGEGKTLVATLPAYLNALIGRGVHIVTVNDYLAKRDAQWMGPIYDKLGLSVGVIQHEASFLYDPAYVTSDLRLTCLRPSTRPEAYRADITYGTNNEFGCDYLRDNMRFSLDELVQRELHYAIVDEVDSILIDEARTPLIISGPADESTDLYYKIDRIIPKLRRAATIVEGKLSEIEAEKKGDFIVDEKARAVALTEEGIATCERLLNVENLYDPRNMTMLHHIQQGLRAHALFRRDVDYIVKDGQVVIIDEFTGRQMPGRRWSDGLHQAVEAKEAVRIERENQTLATITFQNYFRMYDKLAGMTGTAETEAEEFAKIYKLDVTVVPTNRTLGRVNFPDVVYKTEREKFNAVVDDVIERHQKGQPCLVGTVSIEKSETLSSLLKKRGIRHEVLNAKYHEREAEIVAQAGRESAVTIATNMAGRGTDILLGGNPDFLSKELLRKKGLDPATAPAEARQAALVESRRITEPEHEKVVATGGLHIVGTERHESRRIEDLAPVTLDSFAGPAVHPEEWDLAGLNEALFQQFDVRIPASAYQEVTSRDGLNELVLDAVKSRYVDRERELGEELMRALERHEMLIVIDTQWKDHLLSIDHLKEGIGLRGYGQRDPLTEYKKEAFDLFQDMAERVKAAVVERLFKVQVVREAPMAMPTLTARADTQESRGEMPSVGGEAPRAAPLAAPPRPAPRTATGDKVGRNDPCPCGSGKKYKKCCYLKGT